MPLCAGVVLFHVRRSASTLDPHSNPPDYWTAVPHPSALRLRVSRPILSVTHAMPVSPDGPGPGPMPKARSASSPPAPKGAQEPPLIPPRQLFGSPPRQSSDGRARPVHAIALAARPGPASPPRPGPHNGGSTRGAPRLSASDRPVPQATQGSIDQASMTPNAMVAWGAMFTRDAKRGDPHGR